MKNLKKLLSVLLSVGMLLALTLTPALAIVGPGGENPAGQVGPGGENPNGASVGGPETANPAGDGTMGGPETANPNGASVGGEGTENPYGNGNVGGPETANPNGASVGGEGTESPSGIVGPGAESPSGDVGPGGENPDGQVGPGGENPNGASVGGEGTENPYGNGNVGGPETANPNGASVGGEGTESPSGIVGPGAESPSGDVGPGGENPDGQVGPGGENPFGDGFVGMGGGCAIVGPGGENPFGDGTVGPGGENVNYVTTENIGNLPEESGTAYAKEGSLTLNGEARSFAGYAIRNDTGDTTYIRLRDMAYLLSGTGVQFNVEWNGSIVLTSKTAYTPVAGDTTVPFTGEQDYKKVAGTVLMDGEQVELQLFQLTDANGGGYTYVRLVELAELLNFRVWYEDGYQMDTTAPFSWMDFPVYPG